MKFTFFHIIKFFIGDLLSIIFYKIVTFWFVVALSSLKGYALCATTNGRHDFPKHHELVQGMYLAKVAYKKKIGIAE
ncbi:MAG: hypothetical protein PUP93_24510 [Rhizonema sp. NSF051]|nr:hypothetical protein [Rhizonema sp. NSF051]